MSCPFILSLPGPPNDFHTWGITKVLRTVPILVKRCNTLLHRTNFCVKRWKQHFPVSTRSEFTVFTPNPTRYILSLLDLPNDSDSRESSYGTRCWSAPRRWRRLKIYQRLDRAIHRGLCRRHGVSVDLPSPASVRGASAAPFNSGTRRHVSHCLMRSLGFRVAAVLSGRTTGISYSVQYGVLSEVSRFRNRLS